MTRETIQENGFEDRSCLKPKHKICGGNAKYGNPLTEMLREQDDSKGETKKTTTKEGGASPKMLTSSNKVRRS